MRGFHAYHVPKPRTFHQRVYFLPPLSWDSPQSPFISCHDRLSSIDHFSGSTAFDDLLFSCYAYVPHVRELILYLFLSFGLILLNIIPSSSIYEMEHCMISFFLCASTILLWKCIIGFLSCHLFLSIVVFRF